ncbi:MAG: PhoH family protein [Microbacteriaceae bacterium]|nr:PhoH family protein [Microbacteriaceae bacterium]
MTVDGQAMIRLLGPEDLLLKELQRQVPAVKVNVRNNEISIEGDRQEVEKATVVIEELVAFTGSGVAKLILTAKGKSIRPKTKGQSEYVNAIAKNTIVFGIGPAGTGKTYLAMACAVRALQDKEVDRIILTRPAVEAGEKLGFLPGSLTDKIDPYLRPLYDALQEMLDGELIPKLMASGVIEVAPLAYMRGRTLNRSFVILDEAQNTTNEQMKMFLTRLGFGSKMVITGDVTQIDLAHGFSGLKQVSKVLKNVEDIHFSNLTSKDVVRHALVTKIVDAYAAIEDTKQRTDARHQNEGKDTKTRQGRK